MSTIQFAYGWESITPVHHEPSEVAAARDASVKAWANYLAATDNLIFAEEKTPWETQKIADLEEVMADLLIVAQRAESEYHRIYRENGEREANNGRH